MRQTFQEVCSGTAEEAEQRFAQITLAYTPWSTGIVEVVNGEIHRFHRAL